MYISSSRRTGGRSHRLTLRCSRLRASRRRSAGRSHEACERLLVKPGHTKAGGGSGEPKDPIGAFPKGCGGSPHGFWGLPPRVLGVFQGFCLQVPCMSEQCSSASGVVFAVFAIFRWCPPGPDICELCTCISVAILVQAKRVLLLRASVPVAPQAL